MKSNHESLHSSQDDDFAVTITQEGDIGTAGSYKIEYFSNAQPAQRQIEDSNIPNVLDERGNLLILDITSWPEGWRTGKIIVVRMMDGIVEYKRLITKFELLDGQLAIGVSETGLLEVIASCEIDIEGDLADTQSLSDISNRFARGLVDVADIEDERTFWIINETNISIFEYQGTGVEVELGFPEISLKVTPYVILRVIIEKRFGFSDIFGFITDIYAETFRIAGDILDIVGGVIIEDDDGNSVAEVDAEDAATIVEYILVAQEVVEKLDAISQVLNDRTRLKEGLASVDGDIKGEIQLSAYASAAYTPDQLERELGTILVPITGPIPIFLQFDVVAVVSLAFHAQIVTTTGMSVNLPFSAEIQVVNGEITEPEVPSLSPSFDFLEPTFDGTKAELELSAGVQVESGVTLAKLISATIDPTAEIVFETVADVEGDINETCINLEWDVFARFGAELEAELSLPLIGTWEKSLDLPSFTLWENEWPMDFYEACWETLSAISGIVKDAVANTPLSDVTVSVFDSSDSFVTSDISDSDGLYTIQCPEGTDYTVWYEKASYITTVYNAVDVVMDETTHLETALQVDEAYSGTGDISGTIRNALDDTGVVGLDVVLREGINNVSDGSAVTSTTTNTDGHYTFSDVPASVYTATASGSGYIDTSFTVVSIGGEETGDQDASITPVLDLDEIRIILKWGESPSDLDAHLRGPASDGETFHCYFGDKNPDPGYVNLDKDDTQGNGTETITIEQSLDGIYKYLVHDYTNRQSTISTALSNSNAIVNVYKGSDLLAAYNVPTGQGGTVWSVFELDGTSGNITTLNAMSYESNPSDVRRLNAGQTQYLCTDKWLFNDLPEK